MLKRTVIAKLFIDITMIIVYALLMFARSLGGFFHETVGLGMGILFLIHIVLNRSMVAGLFTAVKTKQPKKIVLLALDIALTICMPTVIITGVLIAKDLFVIQSDIPWRLLCNIHSVLSYVCLGIMALHILLHAKYLLGVLKKLPSSLAKKELMPVVFCCSAGVIVAVACYLFLAARKSTLDDKNAPETADSTVAENTVPNTPASSFERQADSTMPIMPDDQNALKIPDAIDSEIRAPATLARKSERQAESALPAIDEVLEVNDAGQSGANDEASMAARAKNTDTERTVATNDTDSAHPTLEAYLSQLRCTGCGRGCILLNPRCRTGAAQASRTEAAYNLLYGSQSK
ncbi:MAG: DUF4405 domain-containing protein [Treponemataceae bacterium]|nr:DUF4405 domain-containing protein [Treponemataceae bacterium]